MPRGSGALPFNNVYHPYSRNKGKSLFSIKITYNRLFSTEGLANVKNIIDKQSLLSIY